MSLDKPVPGNFRVAFQPIGFENEALLPEHGNLHTRFGQCGSADGGSGETEEPGSGDPPSGREEAAQQQTVSGASRTRLFTREQLPSFSPRKPREESKEILVAGQAST